MTRLSTLVGMAILGMAFLVGAGASQDAKKEEPSTKMKAYSPPGWKALGLTKEQAFEISKIHDKHKSKIKALQDQINDAKTVERQEMVKLLTADQKEKLLKLVTGDDASKNADEKK